MRVLNTDFAFTVKVGKDHFGGHFEYQKNGAETVKMSFRRLPVVKENGLAFTQVNYLRLQNGQWLLWDVNRKTPKTAKQDDIAVFAIFREALALSQLAEA
jgi:hypothetical protein